MFVIHIILDVVIVMVTYASAAKTVIRRFGSSKALPNVAAAGL